MKWPELEGAGFRIRGMRVWLAIAFLLAWCLVASRANGQDFQSWNEVDLTGSWKTIDVVVPLLARIDASGANPQLAATGITADFGLPWHLTLTGGYLYAKLPRSSLDVSVPLAAVAKSFRFGRFAIADRNRFEKLIGFGDSPVRYRNRILAERPLGTQARWRIFASDEVFFNLSARNWNQNRAQAGIGRRLSRRVFLDVFYLQRNIREGAPTTHALGTTLRIELKARLETPA
ncbi:MAG TPA: DUF2490 domain-containing protein [Candidatus Acidoferrum sp.]|jgi:hypothetical protein|nr:DUF2490 domain-containing protein [Candidatus Acidoferrum sp.]